MFNYSAYFIGAYFTPYVSQATPGATPLIFESILYDGPLAYLLCLGSFIIGSFIWMFYKFLDAYYTNNIQSSHRSKDSNMAETLFSGYDFALITESSVKMKQLSLLTDFKEIRGEETAQLSWGKRNNNKRLFFRVLANILVISLLGADLYVIGYVVTKYAAADLLSERLIPSIVLTGSTLVLPIIFKSIAQSMEDWQTALYLIEVTVVRNLILRIAGLFVFIYQLFVQSKKFMCWESFIGQYVYQVIFSRYSFHFF